MQNGVFGMWAPRSTIPGDETSRNRQVALMTFQECRPSAHGFSMEWQRFGRLESPFHKDQILARERSRSAPPRCLELPAISQGRPLNPAGLVNAPRIRSSWRARILIAKKGRPIRRFESRFNESERSGEHRSWGREMCHDVFGEET
jgi:hypothetical protein